MEYKFRSPVTRKGTDAPTVCTATLLAAPCGYANTAAVMQ